MEKFFNKVITTAITIVIVVAVFVSLREQINSDETMKDCFDALFGMLPFSKFTASVIEKIMNCKGTLDLESENLLKGLLKLELMAFFQPMISWGLCAIFLRIPTPTKSNSAQLEDYMDRNLGYRIKQLLIDMVSAVASAWLVSGIATYLMGIVAEKMNDWISGIIGVISMFALCAASALPLILMGTTILTSILWRVVVTLGGGMVKMVLLDACCMAIYLAFVSDNAFYKFVSISSFILLFVVFDVGFQCLRRAVVGFGK